MTTSNRLTINRVTPAYWTVTLNNPPHSPCPIACDLDRQTGGRARGHGSEFVLACDMRFASREKAVLAQFEVGGGVVPGGGRASGCPRLWAVREHSR
jgi:hypothetical protein